MIPNQTPSHPGIALDTNLGNNNTQYTSSKNKLNKLNVMHLYYSIKYNHNSNNLATNIISRYFNDTVKNSFYKENELAMELDQIEKIVENQNNDILAAHSAEFQKDQDQDQTQTQNQAVNFNSEEFLKLRNEMLDLGDNRSGAIDFRKYSDVYSRTMARYCDVLTEKYM